jgi:hypothetical protein
MARYTRRAAIANRRIIAADGGECHFTRRNYRLDGPDSWKTMTLHLH